jgi:hypothetical protein
MGERTTETESLVIVARQRLGIAAVLSPILAVASIALWQLTFVQSLGIASTVGYVAALPTALTGLIVGLFGVAWRSPPRWLAVCGLAASGAATMYIVATLLSVWSAVFASMARAH